MTTRERLTLSAYEKFVLHGRFPWKFCTHVLLLLFSTAQILLWNFEDGGYYRATQDYERAVKLYTLSADQGLANAQSNLGVMYDTGKGVEQDKKRAVELYTLAADQGYANAQFNLVVEVVVLLRVLMLATLLLVVGVRIEGGNCGLGLGRFSFLDCFDSDCNCCWFCG